MRVLIAVEDKEYGEAIANFVSRHKWEPSTKFKILHVMPFEDLDAMGGDLCCYDTVHTLYEARESRAWSLVKGIATKIQIALSGIPAEEEVLPGSPKEAILEAAEDWGAEAIILGSHGRSGLSRFLLGSVAMSVLSHANCSVIIVKLPKAKKTAKDSGKTTIEAQNKEEKQAAQTEHSQRASAIS